MCTFELREDQDQDGRWVAWRDGDDYGAYLDKDEAEKDLRDAASDLRKAGVDVEVLVYDNTGQPYRIF